MNTHARFTIVSNTDERVIIQDVGHHDGPSITNDARAVVAKLAPFVGNRRLYYYDSTGRLDELLIQHGQFAGYRAGDLASEDTKQ